MPAALRPPESVTTPDGVTLALRRWPAATPASRGTILIVHGLGEHSGRYGRLADLLQLRGWEVVGYDHRGHGLSLGRRGAVPHADTLVDDLSLVLDRVVRPRVAAGSPLLLLGQSMGGLVAALFVARAVRPVEGLILTSPALAADLSLAQRIQLRVGRALVPDLPMGNQLVVDALCHDRSVVQAYRDDPLVHDRITARLASAILKGGREVRLAAPRWRVPTLLMWAGEDRLVAASGSDTFAAAAPPAVVRVRRFDALWHEILNEPSSDEVFRTLTGWLDERFPAR